MAQSNGAAQPLMDEAKKKAGMLRNFFGMNQQQPAPAAPAAPANNNWHSQQVDAATKSYAQPSAAPQPAAPTQPDHWTSKAAAKKRMPQMPARK